MRAHFATDLGELFRTFSTCWLCQGKCWTGTGINSGCCNHHSLSLQVLQMLRPSRCEIEFCNFLQLIRRPLPTARGERVREEITSNKCCAVQVRGKRGRDRKGSQVQSKKPKKGSEKGGAVSANVASERSTKQEVRSKNAEARVNERQKVTFGTLGRSVLRCHGVLVLRQGPPKEHKQAGRWLMKGGQSPSLELVSREFRKQTFGTMGCRPRARSVLRCHGVLVLRPRSSKRARASLAGGRWRAGKVPSLELVSREFKKQCLEPWAAGGGPDPSSLKHETRS